MAIVVVIAATLPAAAAHASADDDDLAQQLADRYAPIVMVRTQQDDCDDDGEPFTPISVDAVLDNPQIALRQLGNGDPTVMRGPSAADLADLGGGFYLDFPGDALAPGCVFEQDNARFTASRQPVVYAHIVRQPDRPDVLALQYWIYWYYNDWNNKHESDWEFIQLLFPAGSIADALGEEPLSVGYAQHEGGERAGWNDDKLERAGTHPVVYSSQRSHASYFSSAVYMGRSGAEGFGCDNSDGPSTRIAPDVVVLPDAVSSADDPLAWIEFAGRWGERHGGPNNGPTGPKMKARWTDPLSWDEGLRSDSFVIPAGDGSAATVIDAFCAVVEWGSVKYIEFVASPGRVLLALSALAALGVFLVRRTSWRPVPATPLRRRRRAGEIVRLAGAEYRRRPGVYAAAAAFAVPIVAMAAIVSALLRHLPLIGDVFGAADPDQAGTRLVTASIVSTALVALPFVVIAGLVSGLVDASSSGAGPVGASPVAKGPLGHARGVVRAHAKGLLQAFLIAFTVIVLASITFIGVPLAIWLFVRWQFLTQAAVLDGRSGRAALARSAQLVRGRWWHTALVAGLTTVAVASFGLVVGLGLLVLFTGLPLWGLSAIVAACNILVMPFGALVVTYLYGDAATDGPVARS